MPRIAHPSPDSPARAALLGWIAGTVSDDEARRALPTVDRFLTAQAVTSARQAVRVVCEQRVPWEFLPDAVLREAAVWDALADTIGMTALLRNLARMTRIGTLTPPGSATRRAVARLTDADEAEQGRPTHRGTPLLCCAGLSPAIVVPCHPPHRPRPRRDCRGSGGNRGA